ncbi:hypothetical protein RhiirA5_387035, partial [Rhizophagus irregularis]
DIDPEKVAAVVSDNAPDARVARRILCEKYFHILNIRCMAHCINLITKDVCEHTFVADTVRKVLSEHGNDIKNRVKDILCNRNFYENCQIITSIFHPLKVTYDKFSDDLFLLAFFLHPRYYKGMCKLHTYYITNAKRELPYYAVDTSECSLCEKMIDTLIEISDELVGEGDYDFLYEENIIDTIIDMSKTYNLNVALDIDIDSHIFNMERNESEEDEVIVSHRRQTVVLDPEREDYDIEALIAKEMNDDNGS